LSQKNSKEEVMVSLTDSAVVKFKEVVTKQGAAGDGVRIFVVPGG
jgi:Fe-S cluster assembly iron-binding protein IscA